MILNTMSPLQTGSVNYNEAPAHDAAEVRLNHNEAPARDTAVSARENQTRRTAAPAGGSGCRAVRRDRSC
jgi:hypothetical protein